MPVLIPFADVQNVMPGRFGALANDHVRGVSRPVASQSAHTLNETVNSE